MDKRPHHSSIRDYKKHAPVFTTFAGRFAAQHNFGLTIIRSLFFLNAGTIFLIYNFAHAHPQFENAYPAILVSLVGIVDCFIAGYLGWKHWIKEGTPEYDGNTTENMDPPVKLALIFTFCAAAMWILSIGLMLRYYSMI